MSNLTPLPQDDLAPATPASELSLTPSPHTPSAARDASLALLDTLQTTFLPKAQEGDPAAALIVISVLKHRATLLGLSPSPALRVAASSASLTSDSAGSAPGELKLVVEYVNDWREALRRRS